MEETISSLSSLDEETPDDLLLISEHSEQTLFNCLSKRLSQGFSYTFAGPILISINSEKTTDEFSAKTRDSYSENPVNEPHLYAISSKAYNHLKISNQNQVISLVGYSGAGKTFAAIHLLDHLIHEAGFDNILFSMIHSSIQLIHVMGSIMSNDNTESTVCGMVTNLLYDSTYKVVGASIKAKLLDFTLPYSPIGMTYHVLHSLTSASKTQLQSLGLSSYPTFKLFNSQPASGNQILTNVQNFERFLKNLNTLKFSRSEIQEILEVLSCVILLFEINFVGNNFVVAGEKDYTE